MDGHGDDVEQEPHRAATVRDALDLLQHSALDLPEEGLFDDVVVEVRGDPALGRTPDPQILREPLTLRVSIQAFISTLDDGTLESPRMRAIDVRVIINEDGYCGAWARDGSIDELRRALASPEFEQDVLTMFRYLAEHYCDMD